MSIPIQQNSIVFQNLLQGSQCLDQNTLRIDILSMVESSLGIGILPRLILQRIPYQVEIRGFTQPYYREIALALPGKKSTSTAVKRFIEYLIYR